MIIIDFESIRLEIHSHAWRTQTNAALIRPPIDSVICIIVRRFVLNVIGFRFGFFSCTIRAPDFRMNGVFFLLLIVSCGFCVYFFNKHAAFCKNGVAAVVVHLLFRTNTNTLRHTRTHTHTLSNYIF